jgi:2-polyprenyl-6-methoxyphenol hydroxylase-like FAD-dependent oxidoreductase
MSSVLIVGAGIAGLATAFRLRRSGWQVTIVERAPSLRGGGYMIGFSGIGYQTARDWGLLPALEELQPPMVDLVYVDESGRQRAVLPVAAQRATVGPELLSLLRGDLEEVLFKALGHNPGEDDSPGETLDIRFGTSVTRIVQDDDSVTATLTDGTEIRADLLIGADGLHSKVRELVFGPERSFRRDYGAGIATVLLDQRPAGVRTDQTTSMGLVGRGVGLYTTVRGQTAGFFAFATDDLEADLAAGPRVTLRRIFGDLRWVVPELLDQVDKAVDAGDGVYFDGISQIVMDRWTTGRVVLVGDAAWCVSLMAGYGSSLAVGGADLLGQMLDRVLDGHDLPEALSRWEHELRPIVEKKQQQGRRARGLFVARSQMALAVSHAVFRLAGNRLVTAAMRRFLGLEGDTKATNGTKGAHR